MIETPMPTANYGIERHRNVSTLQRLNEEDTLTVGHEWVGIPMHNEKRSCTPVNVCNRIGLVDGACVLLNRPTNQL